MSARPQIRKLFRDLHVQIVRCMTHFYQPEVDKLPQCRSKLGYSTDTPLAELHHKQTQNTYPQQILFLAEAVQVSPAKWQCSETLFDDVEKLASRCNAQRHNRSIGAQCIMRRFQLLSLNNDSEPLPRRKLTSSRT